jgi:hypothetical protein
VLDAGLPRDVRVRHLQAAAAARATLGLDVGAWTRASAEAQPRGRQQGLPAIAEESDGDEEVEDQ